MEREHPMDHKRPSATSTNSNWSKAEHDDSNEQSKFSTFQANPVVDISQFCYPIRANCVKGRCVILNYEKFFIFEKPRKGSKYDVRALKKTFSTFKFQIVEHHNLTVQQTIDVLQFESSQDHSQFDCFVLFILSHGERDSIYCSDDSLPLNSIFDWLLPQKCPTLQGKPKLLFIQACRGELFDSGTLVTDGPLDTDQDQGHFLVPNCPDFLVFYSTYPGFVSWRNKDKGSWFIQDLCAALRKYAAHFDLQIILSIVTRNIAFNRCSQGKVKNMKQMPCAMSTLTKLVRLQ